MPAVSATNPALESRTPNPIRGRRFFYPQLDGLRAAAVFLVLMRHMDDLTLPAPLVYLCSLGWSGVDIFFVLSGFLITSILLSYKPGFRSYGVFVLRRTLRTWPLYFVVLLLAYLTVRHDVAGTHANWLEHVFFLQNFNPDFPVRTLTPTWSLCIEEHFYVVWPILIFLLPRRALPWTLSAVFVTLPLVRFWGLHHVFTYKQLYTETQFHLDGLVAGSLVALLVAHRAIRQRTMLWAAYGCLIVGVATTLLGFWGNWNSPGRDNVVFGFTSLAITFAGLLLFLLHGESSVLGRVFSLGPIRYIGRISYGIYLLQDGVFTLLARLAQHPWLAPLAKSWIFAIPLRIGLIVCVAAISYRFFESPILRIKDRLR